MKTIVFAATKGGVSKTTLAFNVGVEAAKHGSVFLADMDPQRSLQTFAEIRGGGNPLLLKNVHSVKRAVSELTKKGFARDYLIVDTPGSFMDIIEDAVGAADCIVLPMQPSPIDILAQEDVLLLVDKLGKKHDTLAVLSRVDGRTGIDDVTKRVMSMLPTPHADIRNRIAYARAMVIGKSGPEIDVNCAKEISDLWSAIERIIGHEDVRGRYEQPAAEISEGSRAS